MLSIFDDVVSRVRELMGDMSVKQFANKIGMTQQTVDLYLKGARKPSVEFLYNICCSYNVSADWLLGLDTAKSGPNGAAPPQPPPAPPSGDCANCKYKRLAEVIKATL